MEGVCDSEYGVTIVYVVCGQCVWHCISVHDVVNACEDCTLCQNVILLFPELISVNCNENGLK